MGKLVHPNLQTTRVLIYYVRALLTSTLTKKSLFFSNFAITYICQLKNQKTSPIKLRGAHFWSQSKFSIRLYIPFGNMRLWSKLSLLTVLGSLPGTEDVLYMYINGRKNHRNKNNITIPKVTLTLISLF